MNRRGFLAALFAPVLAPFLPKPSLLETINAGIRPEWNGFVRSVPRPGETMWFLNTKYLRLPSEGYRFKTSLEDSFFLGPSMKEVIYANPGSPPQKGALGCSN